MVMAIIIAPTGFSARLNRVVVQLFAVLNSSLSWFRFMTTFLFPHVRFMFDGSGGGFRRVTGRILAVPLLSSTCPSSSHINPLQGVPSHRVVSACFSPKFW